MPPAVLVVARWYPSHDQPGRGTFVADLVHALTGAGARVVVASFETTQFRRTSTDFDLATAEAAWASAVADPDVLSQPRSWGAGVPVARLPVIRSWASGSDFDRMEQVRRHAAVLRPFALALAARMRIDVVHAHTGLPDGVAAAAVADDLGVPLLISEHDSTVIDRLDADHDALAAYRSLAGARRQVVAVSPPLAAALTDRVQPVDRIGVIPNPVPLDEFPLGADAHRDPDELLWVGARAEHKGTERLLRGFAAARAARPNLRLRLVGSSRDGDGEWRALADELGVADGVSIEPAADRAGVAEAMRRATLFVHPSPFETFGMVAAEALASGLPVAATPSGGVESIIGSDGTAGVLAHSLEPAALAEAIVAALDRRSSFDGSRLRASVADRFGPGVVATEVLETYERLGMVAGGDVDEVTLITDRRPVAAAVALHASGVRRVNDLPASARRGLTVVANPGPARDLRLDVVGRVVTVELPKSPPSATLARVLRSVVGRGKEPAPLEPPRVGQAAAVAAAAAVASVDLESDALIVAADGDDVVPILEAGRGSALAPGSLRWLADRDDEAAGPVSP